MADKRIADQVGDQPLSDLLTLAFGNAAITEARSSKHWPSFTRSMTSWSSR
jgi:hypothetical protein